MQRLKVIFADDHRIIREGVKVLMGKQDLYEIEFIEAVNGREAVELYRKHGSVDVVILNIHMPVMDGMTACREILSFDVNARVVFLSMQDEGFTIGRALQSGAKGYIMNDSGIAEIMNAITNVVKGGEYISPGTLLRFAEYHNPLKPGADKKKITEPKDELTKRERHIVELISMEKTSQEIAHELKLSRRTVEKHRYKIMNKLGVKSAAGLIKYAIGRGWIAIENFHYQSTC